MSTPYLGEVRIVSFNFPPKGWAFCNGQLLPIPQNQALFSLLGTTYGGDGKTTFGLPNLQTRVPVCSGNGAGLPGVSLGQAGGEATHTLTIPEMAGHAHAAQASQISANATNPAGSLLGSNVSFSIFSPSAPNTTLVSGTIGKAGSGQPHDNMQPYLVLNFVIALTGIFPSRG